MNTAAEQLYRYTDFTSFSKLHTDVKTNNCRVTFARWEPEGERQVFTITEVEISPITAGEGFDKW